MREKFRREKLKKMEETNFASRIKKLRIKDFQRNFSKEKIGEKTKIFQGEKFRREKLKKNGGHKFCIQN